MQGLNSIFLLLAVCGAIFIGALLLSVVMFKWFVCAINFADLKVAL